jgi:signal transduction histidine kinase
MTPRRFGRLPPRTTLALFVAVAAVSVAALVWMGARVLSQERALEDRRLEERLEAAADRAVAGVEQALLAEERRLSSTAPPQPAPADDALLVVSSGSGIEVRPETTILFYPVIQPPPLPSPTVYARAERLEFVERDHEQAAAVLRRLARSKDPSVRAGAELRLARNFRKAGRAEAALDTYGDLARVPGARVSGLPAQMVAGSGRCLLLEELGRGDELRGEAAALGEALASGRWKLDRDAYMYYSDQVAGWLGHNVPADAGRLALSEAVAWIWENLRSDRRVQAETTGRDSLSFGAVPVTVLWEASAAGITALVAGPEYQQRRWFAPLFEDPDFAGIRVSARDRRSGLVYGDPPPAGVPVALRSASSTSLPWDITSFAPDVNEAFNGFAQRRRVLVLGLCLVVLFVVAASYFASRAVARELAAARLQSDFVSAVSHEFRSPLTSMKQFTEMLVEDEDLPEDERREYYRAQERATGRLSRLVESLLDFGRMEAGARPYRREPLDAVELVRTAVEEFRQEGGGNGFTIECDVPNSGVQIEGDREALAQALWNLIDNAVKYSGDGRNVRVEVEAGSDVAIRVRDQGLGVPAGERQRIFEKFARGSSAAATGVKGTGIGLAMVAHIVSAHGGKVTLECPPEGGSVFGMVLPRGRTGDADAPNPHRRRRG